KKQPLIVSNANHIEKLKAMHENYQKKFFTQNASKILKNKDGKGSAYIQQIKENLKKRKEEEANKQETKDLGNLFQQHLTKKDPPNQ
ncbi:replication initiation protein, partial [Helicobacter pylori]